MGNKARRQASRKEPFVSPQQVEGPQNRPRVLFAAGDADYGYTEGKIWRLPERLKKQTGCQVVAVSHDAEAITAAKKLMLDTEIFKIESAGITVEDRLRSTDEMIRQTAEIHIPGSRLPLWKVLAMDDFLSSLQLFGAQPAMTFEADAVIVPLMAIDNNTKASCGLYTWMVSEARRKGIPVVGLEVSPLGNKNTLSHLPADHYAVKNEWSKEFLIMQGIAMPDQVSVLRFEESYLLWPGADEYTDAYLQHEAKAREMLKVSDDELIVLVPHHVAFLWEVRNILQALAQIEIPMTVVIRVDPRTIRRHYPEREIVLQTYRKEIRALQRVVIDEQVGVGLLLQLADLVVSPFAGTTTERASLCRKPTIICQAMGQEGWRGEFLYWEPRPEKITELIRSWKQKGWLDRVRLARIVATVLSNAVKAAA